MTDESTGNLPFDKESFYSHEKEILKYWKENDVVKKIMEVEYTEGTYEAMDGPPFVSGSLHMGHLVVSAIKDYMQRYMHMHGKKTINKLGYDCHGLPIENMIMKMLGLKSIDDIVKFGVDKFNKICKETIDKLSGSWEPSFDIIGRWADFKNVYMTKDTNFMETCWWIFKTMHDRGLVYEGYKVMPYSYSCETPLSNFEAGSEYKDIDSKSSYVLFPLKNDTNVNIVAWTTTPWTLPSNVALCVNPNLEYILCTDENGKKYVVADGHQNNLSPVKILTSEPYMKGSQMVGLEYIPPFDYVKLKCHTVIADEYVKGTGAIGTGVVHISPAHGNDDYRVCVENKIINKKDLKQVCFVNSDGTFDVVIEKYAGMLVFDADIEIVKDLKKKGIIVKTQTYKHSYPHCPRAHTPLIYMAVSSYFIEVTKVKGKLIELNSRVNWTRKEIGAGRFHNWLDQTEDWCVSRNRFFGTPLPIWVSDDGSEIVVIGSIQELVGKAKLSHVPTDIHKEFVDGITIVSEVTGNVLKNVGMVFDCWFESGSVPFGQLHWPFENSDYFDGKDYLSEFVAEGLDQTRGWFYTLLVISTIILEKPPYKNVMCTGMILDGEGKKISKSAGNFFDPAELIQKSGADIVRLYLLRSQVINGEPLQLGDDKKAKDDKKKTIVEKIDDKLRKDIKERMLPFVNSIQFFMVHFQNYKKNHQHNPDAIKYIQTIDESSFTDKPEFAGPLTVLDKWILEKVYLLRVAIDNHTDKYEIDFATRAIIDFVEELTNWYLKLSRDRLKGSCGDDDWTTSLHVMYTVLWEYLLISAPFIPFLTEHIYLHLVDPLQRKESIHLERYPKVSRNYGMSKVFSQIQNIAKAIRYARDSTTTHRSVKIPIKECHILYTDEKALKNIREYVQEIADEINCLEMRYILIGDNAMLYEVEPNMRTLGKKFKKNAEAIAKALRDLPIDITKNYYVNKVDSLTIEYVDEKGTNCKVDLEKEDFEILVKIETKNTGNFQIIEKDGFLVCVDMTYNESIYCEYEARKIAAFIQQFRKLNKLNPWNRLTIKYQTDHKIAENIITTHQDFLVHRLGTKMTPCDDSSEVFSYTLNYSVDAYVDGKEIVFHINVHT